MDTKFQDPARWLMLAFVVTFTVPCATLATPSLPTPVLLALAEGEADEVIIQESDIEERDGIVYRIGMPEPFTGKVVSFYYNGQKMTETGFLNGIKNGKALSWYESGSMRMESGYKNGERDGMWTKWDENGHIQFQRQYRDGARLR